MSIGKGGVGELKEGLTGISFWAGVLVMSMTTFSCRTYCAKGVSRYPATSSRSGGPLTGAHPLPRLSTGAGVVGVGVPSSVSTARGPTETVKK